MPKRGQRLPFRMTYTWPGGRSGTVACSSLEDATFRAEQQAAVVGPAGDRCTVTVTHRDTGQVFLTLEPEGTQA